MSPSDTSVLGVRLTEKALFRQACYVDGAWIQAQTGGTIAVDDPATGDVIGTVPRFGVGETRAAIEAAERALPEWRRKTGKERAAILRKW